MHYSLSNRNGDVPSVWTEILNGRVRTSRNLKRRSYGNVYNPACPFIANILHINKGQLFIRNFLHNINVPSF